MAIKAAKVPTLEAERWKKLRLYLDMCVYNRPFDDQSQPRIMLETQIFIMMLLMISKDRFDLINSFALEYENSKNPNIENMLKISDLLGYSTDYISCDEGILDRSLEFEKYGLMGMDAVHIACAEKAKADFFVTCDDDLIKKLERIDNIGIAYYNVIDFVSREVFKT
jgi:predicted nucleic acid-binding protein